ncbi:unnamed protein product [Pedinophyceae sp. YPF-701]|nr:unnamed protein product [Pedinophyceae sp. YPF-701]
MQSVSLHSLRVRHVPAAAAPARTPAAPQRAAALLARPGKNVRRVTAHAAAAASPDDAGKGQYIETARLMSSKAGKVEPAVAAENPQFRLRRLLCFVGIMIGYGCFYLTRTSLNFVAPVMEQDPTLGFNITKVGILASAFPIAYSCSKLVSGVLGDRMKPSQMLAFGMVSTAAANIALGLGNTMEWFVAFWILNGLLQGIGAPACARLMTSWYSSNERGTIWGIWTTSNNMGGALSPLIAGSAAKNFGWRYGMFAPGIIVASLSVAALALIRDTPRQAGFKGVGVEGDSSNSAVSSQSSMDEDEIAEIQAKEKAEKDAASKLVFRSPAMWAMALAYFFVYAVRQGASAWFMFYLIKGKGLADAGQAAVYLSALEIGGLCGALMAGKVSDHLIANAPSNVGTVGKRVQVMLAYTVALAGAMVLFAKVPVEVAWMQWGAVFLVGFALYGPQMLMGLAGSEVAGPKAVGASQGLLGWISYMGAASAGVPMSILVNQYGWGSFFVAMCVCCVAIVVLLTPLWNQPSYIQKKKWEAEAAAA